VTRITLPRNDIPNKIVNIFYISLRTNRDSARPAPNRTRDPQHRLTDPHGGYWATDSHSVSLSKGRSLVRTLTLAVAIAALWTLSACKKTGEGQYEVQKPVIGTETDTVNTPTVETGTVKDTIEVTRPTVEVKKPKE
jgi:hypothetical protein